jgi:(S)-ureidoglycine aminohydrolase
MKELFLPLLLCLSITSAKAQEIADPAAATAMLIHRQPVAGPDTLTATVFHVPTGASAQGRPMVDGATRDLSQLRVSVHTLGAGASFSPPSGDNSDHLLIMAEGRLAVDIDTLHKNLGPGGIGLFKAGARPSLQNNGSRNAVFYLFAFRSRQSANPDQASAAGSPIVIDWSDLAMKKTDKGESRQIFSCPVTWLSKIDMHATTLDPGQISHPQHMHRAEEIILLRSGHVRMHIADGYQNASAGDLVFLPSGVPHDLENSKTGRTEYFALQWAL